MVQAVGPEENMVCAGLTRRKRQLGDFANTLLGRVFNKACVCGRDVAPNVVFSLLPQDHALRLPA
jgi:hypothetical protein